MDELLSLLQINIALGILHIGLRGGRYREKLLRSLAELIDTRAQQFREALEYDRLAGIDDKFQRRHHAVARWVSELPADRMDDIDAVTRRFTTTKMPPLLYRWFRGHWDKRVCFTVLTILGIAMTWLVVYLGDDVLRSLSLRIIYGLIALGQVLVAFHVVPSHAATEINATDATAAAIALLQRGDYACFATHPINQGTSSPGSF